MRCHSAPARPISTDATISAGNELDEAEQTEARDAQRQPGEDHGFVADPVGEAAAEQEHALLAEGYARPGSV